ncbi:MAG: hypothetical protein A2X05_08190 [Bacteroidetes bacterium GWE2_41_25]|nr:MAG: hypothetical protein A2X03_00440 [Bacteroidetes bacterium GWA2_40_15]OFX93337.1 MAG: hypothetical protein A2X05_08190 [Bacteroidetes bacterium GWE2_41_25]OFY60798.1 MAG: hypothetical protein A2X04_01535 [Bacteroidetes bacterium GWF2_41_9]HAM10259.1 hypothetical protein [Bacteroidales bacterium]HBQ84667.1 hypothetical protein [Bacteroidales bacterium]
MQSRCCISVILLLLISFSSFAQEITHSRDEKAVVIADKSGNLQIEIDYSKGCRISRLIVKGRNTLSASGAFTSVKTADNLYTSPESSARAKVVKRKNGLTIRNIIFGDEEMTVSETWEFAIAGSTIEWKINRQYRNRGTLDDMAMPAWHFEKLNTWKAGILNTGGVVWCKYFENLNDTYGVHTNGVTFWETESGNGLRIEADSQTGGHIACSFSHAQDEEFKLTQYLTTDELGQRYNLSRFVSKKKDVFAPFNVDMGVASVILNISYVDYDKEYDRGTLPGIDEVAVRELLNTTGRYGVVDRNITGGNGWVTNWKCLHEPFFAQTGMAINDKNYLRNLASTLDQERDQAIEADGRVLARWHDIPEAQKSNYNFKTGYYDCPWGYTIDAQPSQVINTVELFHQTGDLNWLRSHKENCEKVLNWLIKRDSNNNGIFEMLNDNTGENKCSDWIDVVWASFENAFVNAQMYEALNLWSGCESILGDTGKAAYYSRIADRLKVAFNKPVQYGGFWYPEKRQYIYWRDKDGSLHGDNLVTPVNFAAIAFGLCEDPVRIKEILDQIEEKTSAEKLFHWPLCFESFREEEVYKPVNWPFPNYENGDIFPTWGYLGVRSYVKYDKTIALKYIKNLLQQYNKDGLSSQRFSRTTQQGKGSDILAGSSTTIAALYRDIYGIRPKWNRFGIEPNMLKELNGTEFSYTFTGKKYNVRLNEDKYELSNDDFTITAGQSFGVSTDGNNLLYYPGNKDIARLSVTKSIIDPVKVDIAQWDEGIMEWSILSPGIFRFIVSGLKPGSQYRLKTGADEEKLVISGSDGNLNFEYTCQDMVKFTLIR